MDISEVHGYLSSLISLNSKHYGTPSVISRLHDMVSCSVDVSAPSVERESGGSRTEKSLLRHFTELVVVLQIYSFFCGLHKEICSHRK